DSQTNRDCLASFHKLYGHEVPANMCWEAAGFQVHLFAQAMRRSGSDELERLMPHLLGSEYDAPQGRVWVDPQNHHTRLYPRIGRIDDGGAFEIVAQSTVGVDPDPYLVNHSANEWSLQSQALGGTGV
ncbi:MAG: periplasmic binding domain protein, partial [Rhizobacter sp.]|nr:periplasmic binding domain protein [Rhizobacter sp.]